MTPAYTVGCDLVALDEIRGSLADFGDRFLRRVFTSAEVAAADDGRDVARLAARFAAKEAVIKALALGDEATVPTEIEVVGAGEVPRMVLHGTMAQRAHDRGWHHLQVTLSHTDCHAMAMIIAELAPTPEP